WWLKSRSVPVAGPFERFYGFSIYVCDPDGAIVEIVTPKDGLNLDYVKELLNRGIEVKHIDDEMKLIAFDHATIIGQDAELVCRFYEKFVGVSTWEKVIDEGGRTYLVALDDERNAYLHYLIPNEADYGLVGRGAIHHVAFAVDDELDQRSIMRRLNSVNLSNSGIVDRFWFRSLYFRDPDGNLLEVATVGPGYAVDEPWDQLGNKLVLPPWIESMRPEIEEALAKLDSDNPFRWPPDFPVLPEDPEVYPPSQTRSNTLNT
ncbi:MAG: VOC family protein, partial [Aigarchaeota archaeon]|nr:VOC family protein [Aigarchaeota archaeon]